MATRDAALALGVGDVIGTLAPGQAADIAIFDGRGHLDHRAVIDTDPEDVVLVLRRSVDGGGDSVFPLDGDALDLCPTVFDPIRPMDHGEQPDSDLDGVDDACDPCPLSADTDLCTLPRTTDLDNDGFDAAGDTCPDAPTPDATPCPTTLYDIEDPDGPYSVGSDVSVSGAIVTAIGYSGFFAQVTPASPG